MISLLLLKNKNVTPIATDTEIIYCNKKMSYVINVQLNVDRCGLFFLLARTQSAAYFACKNQRNSSLLQNSLKNR